MYKKNILNSLFFCLLLIFSFYITKNVQAANTDLTITGYEYSPAKPVVGQLCTIKVKITNTGETNIVNTQGLNDYAYTFSNFQVDKITLPVITDAKLIKPKSYFYYNITGIFEKAGTSTLNFSFNSLKTLPEVDFGDNNLRTTLQVLKLYDLSIDSITSVPSALIVGQDCAISVKIKNNGYASSTDNFGIQSYNYNFQDFTLTDKIIPTFSFYDQLPVGSTTNFVFNGHFNSAGEKSLYFMTDKNNELDENSETNNIKTVKIKIVLPDKTDLAVKSISFSKNKDTLLPRDKFTITVGIINNSDYSFVTGEGLLERDYKYANGGDYTADFAGLSIDSVSHDPYPTKITPLDPGKIFNYKFDVSVLEFGTHAINFKIDNKDKYQETNEDNNSTTTDYTVYQTIAERDEFIFKKIDIINISSSSVMVNWETNKNSTGLVQYMDEKYDEFEVYKSAVRLGDWPSVKTKNKVNQVVLKKLTPGKKYYFVIKGANETVTANSDLGNFTTLTSDEIKITETPSVDLDEAGNSAVISWKTNIMGKGAVYYRIAGTKAYSSAALTTSFLDPVVSLAKLTRGKYEYYCQSTSEAKTTVKSGIGYFNFISTSTNSEITTDVKTDNTAAVEVKSATGKIKINNEKLYKNLKGKIIIKVQSKGEAYYLNPASQEMYFLGRPEDSFTVMRSQGKGITNSDLNKIPIGLLDMSGIDADKDGLSDMLEDAIGTDKNKKDSDGDGFIDKAEIGTGFDPKKNGGAKIKIDAVFSANQKGKILLQVEGKGEAWYINPSDGKRYFLGRPADAFAVMRALGLGVTNNDFSSLN